MEEEQKNGTYTIQEETSSDDGTETSSEISFKAEIWFEEENTQTTTYFEPTQSQGLEDQSQHETRDEEGNLC